jgi:uncharacterized protein (TIGR02246 family)
VIVALVLPALWSCGGPSNGASYDRDQAKAEIEKIERAWAQVAVSGDPTIIETIFADEFVGVAPDGTTYTKQGFIDDTKRNPLGFTSNQLNEINVRFLGNVAIAQGHETFTRKSGELGRFVWTDVLERHQGQWQLVAAQDAMVPVDPQSSSAGLFTEAATEQRAGIDKTRNAYIAAWKAGDTRRIVELYSEDALVLYPDQPAVTGRRAISEYFRKFFNEFTDTEFALTSSEVQIVGAWAYDRGAYRWKAVPRAGGKPIEDTGKHLVILTRQGSGEWKVSRDMDNSDLPAAQGTRGTQ